MAEYVMATKNGNGLVFKKQAESLEEAKQLFIKLKQMTKEDFNKIFVVTEVKNKR
jgi:hypothetical protein|tara:strand:+ start:585 stop:749 length:165 start_codon:yes stop_codon:yes gene_type:complete